MDDSLGAHNRPRGGSRAGVKQARMAERAESERLFQEFVEILKERNPAPDSWAENKRIDSTAKEVLPSAEDYVSREMKEKALTYQKVDLSVHFRSGAVLIFDITAKDQLEVDEQISKGATGLSFTTREQETVRIPMSAIEMAVFEPEIYEAPAADEVPAAAAKSVIVEGPN